MGTLWAVKMGTKEGVIAITPGDHYAMRLAASMNQEADSPETPDRLREAIRSKVEQISMQDAVLLMAYTVLDLVRGRSVEARARKWGTPTQLTIVVDVVTEQVDIIGTLPEEGTYGASGGDGAGLRPQSTGGAVAEGQADRGVGIETDAGPPADCGSPPSRPIL